MIAIQNLSSIFLTFGISLFFLAPLVGADRYSSGSYDNNYAQNRDSNRTVKYYTGRERQPEPDLDYYPTYYGDKNYYFNPKEEYGPRMVDWDYHNSWHYHRDAYLSGYTQPEYYRHRHPHGPGGIGYDPDDAYLHLYNNIAQARNTEKKSGSQNELIADENSKANGNTTERTRYRSADPSYGRPGEKSK